MNNYDNDLDNGSDDWFGMSEMPEIVKPEKDPYGIIKSKSVEYDHGDYFLGPLADIQSKLEAAKNNHPIPEFEKSAVIDDAWDFESSDEVKSEILNGFLNIGNEDIKNALPLKNDNLTVAGNIEIKPSSNEIDNSPTVKTAKLNSRGNSSPDNCDIKNSPTVKNEEKPRKEEIIIKQSGQRPDAPKGGPSLIFSSSISLTKCVGEILLSASPRITIPLQAPGLIQLILSHESLSACPLDYQSNGKKVMFRDPKRKEGKFNLRRDAEMLLVFLGLIFEKDLKYVPESGYQEIHSRQLKSIDERYPHYIAWLVRNGFLQVNNSYCDGKTYSRNGSLVKNDNYSKSYRWNPDFQAVEEYRLQDKFAIRKFVKPEPLEKKVPAYYLESISTLQNKIGTLQVAIDRACDLVTEEFITWNLNNPLSQKEYKDLAIHLARLRKLSDIELIKKSFSRPLKTTRVYSALTSIPRCVKGKGENEIIRLNGEPTLELDIRCSQPSILYTIFKNWTPKESDLAHFSGHSIESLSEVREGELRTFLHYLTTNQEWKTKAPDGSVQVEQMDFYNFLRSELMKLKKGEWKMEKLLSLSRDKIKVMVYNFMFSESKYDLGTDIRDVIQKVFPILFQFVFGKLMSEGKPLWQELSKAESGIVIDKIAMEVAALDFDFFSCHDSIRFPASKYDQVHPIWKRHLKESGIPQPIA
jgi:hypothetical protein